MNTINYRILKSDSLPKMELNNTAIFHVPITSQLYTDTSLFFMVKEQI